MWLSKKPLIGLNCFSLNNCRYLENNVQCHFEFKIRKKRHSVYVFAIVIAKTVSIFYNGPYPIGKFILKNRTNAIYNKFEVAVLQNVSRSCKYNTFNYKIQADKANAKQVNLTFLFV